MLCFWILFTILSLFSFFFLFCLFCGFLLTIALYVLLLFTHSDYFFWYLSQFLTCKLSFQSQGKVPYHVYFLKIQLTKSSASLVSGGTSVVNTLFLDSLMLSRLFNWSFFWHLVTSSDTRVSGVLRVYIRPVMIENLTFWMIVYSIIFTAE